MSSVLLPPELVADILDTFVALNPSHAARTPNLASFAGVSRQWYTAATPLLYRNLYFDSRKRAMLLNTFEMNPDLRPLVQTVSLSGGLLEAGEYERVKAVLAGCTAVRSLTYHCFDRELLEDLTYYISDTWPRLRYLRADQSAHLFDLLGRLPELETLIASYIEFPAPGAATPSPPASRAATPVPSGRSSPTSPVSRPTFRLKRFDSGSSPLPHHFDLLTSSSATSLRSLDLPVSSQTSQDLSPFSSLSHLTLTLAERYLPLQSDLPAAQHAAHAATPGARNDARLLRRVRRVLARADAARVPIRSLEVFEPAYAATSPIGRGAIEEEDLLACVPRGVRRVELASVHELRAAYVAEVFERGERDEDSAARCCADVRELVLSRKVAAQEGAREMCEVLAKRGVEVLWE
ncbi:uncharacterized protein JCM10292_002735 [Rhodotorula paludigena]|uniref:uncharacterized protein n=1 Tax=Rhodotorula paludigena TaxID=86838 RepID=UPI0031809300